MQSIDRPLRVLLIEPNEIARAGLRVLLQDHPGLELTGVAGNHAEALALVAARPDIVLLDLELGLEHHSLPLLLELSAASPQSRVIALTETDDRRLRCRAILLGVVGVVDKASGIEHLLRAITCVATGEVWIGRALMADVIATLPRYGVASRVEEDAGSPDDTALPIATLTPRECEIIHLFCQGLNAKATAARLAISQRTVHTHCRSIFRKLGVADRLELVVFAQRNGLA